LKFQFNKNIEALYLENELNKKTAYIRPYTLAEDIIDIPEKVENETYNMLNDNSYINYSVRHRNKKITWSDLDTSKYNPLLDLNIVNHMLRNVKSRVFSNEIFQYERSDQVTENTHLYDYMLNSFKQAFKDNYVVYGYNDFANISR
jgi:hypothetical protein